MAAVRPVYILCLVLGLMNTAHAGDCRDAVRPLLLQSQPDATAVANARRICEAGRAQGDPDAGYQLALLDLGPDGWNPERATPLIREAADAGVPEAQYWMAWQLEEGPLLANDPVAARGWYEAAAEQSHRLALVRLAQAHEAGELGIAVQPERAAELRALAAQCEANSN